VLRGSIRAGGGQHRPLQFQASDHTNERTKMELIELNNHEKARVFTALTTAFEVGPKPTKPGEAQRLALAEIAAFHTAEMGEILIEAEALGEQITALDATRDVGDGPVGVNTAALVEAVGGNADRARLVAALNGLVPSVRYGDPGAIMKVPNSSKGPELGTKETPLAPLV